MSLRRKIKAFDTFNPDRERAAAYGRLGIPKDVDAPASANADKKVGGALKQFQIALQVTKALENRKRKRRDLNSQQKQPAARNMSKQEAEADEAHKLNQQQVSGSGKSKTSSAQTALSQSVEAHACRVIAHLDSAKAARKAKKQNSSSLDTEIKPGESFSQFAKRVSAEKQAKLAEAGIAKNLRNLSEKKKKYLADKKAQHSNGGGNGENGQLEWKGKTLVQQAEETNSRRNNNNKPSTSNQSAEDEQPNKKRKIMEFKGVEKIAFGDIVDRPPNLTALPKQASKKSSIAKSIRTHRDEEEGEQEPPLTSQAMSKEERYLASEREKALIAAKQEAEARMLTMLREKSVAAYRLGKQKKRFEQLAEKNTKTSKFPNRLDESSSLSPDFLANFRST